ncbi:sigma 54-interacting transcriptional regulator [Fictibacillus sp. B-59209]|uniref:sigma-54 interaction domain-containing protein n=1 Tax=Fictibacillus sp. B-59209 TaxID=3024873 RepID=UPI002E1D232D|nr:sigma 54-interacting transcriptional regulator [Fictibacillus sp. B-59209]
MNIPDTIIGFATIENNSIFSCSSDVRQLLEEIGTEWISSFDLEELPLFLTLNVNVVVKIFLIEANNCLAIFQNITEWRKLQEKNLDLETIFNNSHDGIYVSDGNGVTLGVSLGSERNFGIKSSNLIGRNVIDIEKEGVFRPSVVRLALESRKRVTVYQKTRTGKVMIATGNPIFDENNEIIRVVCNSRDITELTLLKEQIKKNEEIVKRYESELMELRLKETKIEGFITNSKKMNDVLALVKRAAPFDSTILITGETGTGKDVLAKSIHNFSSRKNGPFIKVNCGAIPEHLLESELFGYDTGAFTGASKGGKPGYFELADKGTLFLDEIGELSLSLQAKLLQAIQDKTIQRVGGTKTNHINFRLIAATNRNLDAMVNNKKFREDLFYRLNVIPIEVPLLRERKDDIPFLLHFFLNKYNQLYSMEKRFDLESIDFLCHYDWPGNVRQLQNIVERLVVLSEENKINKENILSLFSKSSIDHEKNASRPLAEVNDLFPDTNEINFDNNFSLKLKLKEVEKSYIQEALREYKSTRKAAKQLKMSQSTLVRRMKELEIDLLNQN